MNKENVILITGATGRGCCKRTSLKRLSRAGYDEKAGRGTGRSVERERRTCSFW